MTYPGVPLVLYDEGHGITEKSKQFFSSVKHLVDEPIALVCFACDNVPVTYNTILWTRKDLILLFSGFSCGYRGEGPHGLLWLCEQCGFTTTIDEIANTSFFFIAKYEED